MPWFRLYHEARSDAKLRLLLDDEHRVWFDLLCFASEQETRGTIAVGEDRFPLAVEVAHGDVDLLARTLARLVKLRIVTDGGDRIVFIHFPDRQYDKPSDQPDRVAERVARHRKGVTTPKVATETPVKRDETPVLFNTELDSELEAETELKGARAPDAASAAAPPKPPSPLKPSVPPKKPAAEQPTPEGFSLLTAICELTNAEPRGDLKRREALHADELLRRCGGDATEAVAYVQFRLNRGDSPQLQFAARDYAPGWRKKAAMARASPNGRVLVSTAADFAALADRLEAEGR